LRASNSVPIATNRYLSISATCLDSTPSHPRFLRLCAALAKLFPPIPTLKQLATRIPTDVLGTIWLCIMLSRDTGTILFRAQESSFLTKRILILQFRDAISTPPATPLCNLSPCFPRCVLIMSCGIVTAAVGQEHKDE
jgi:hypothetical protein